MIRLLLHLEVTGLSLDASDEATHDDEEEVGVDAQKSAWMGNGRTEDRDQG